jgi:hypothetical protein
MNAFFGALIAKSNIGLKRNPMQAKRMIALLGLAGVRTIIETRLDGDPTLVSATNLLWNCCFAHVSGCA